MRPPTEEESTRRYAQQILARWGNCTSSELRPVQRKLKGDPRCRAVGLDLIYGAIRHQMVPNQRVRDLGLDRIVAIITLQMRGIAAGIHEGMRGRP